MFDKTLESPLRSKEIQTLHPIGNQSWIFTGRTDAEAETLILWPPDAKNWLMWKDPDAEWLTTEEKGTTEDEMVGWHHWLKEHEFEKALGVGDGQGSAACYSPWGHKESDMAERLNWTELKMLHKPKLLPTLQLHNPVFLQCIIYKKYTDKFLLVFFLLICLLLQSPRSKPGRVEIKICFSSSTDLIIPSRPLSQETQKLHYKS